MKESDIMRACMIAACECGAIVWRNNVGVLPDRRGVPIRYGLCVGSSDLIGLTKIKIDESMVGKEIAVFTAIEVKTSTGKVTDDQKRFIETVKNLGGISFVARDASDVRENIDANTKKLRDM